MRSLFHLLIVMVLFYAVSCTVKKESKAPAEPGYTRFVDPFIGSDYHGHVFVGANVPFGAVQLGPNNETQGWDWCSGYHYSDSILVGFAHTHLSGTGIGDLGDILFMPVSDEFVPDTISEIPFAWKSSYSHETESAEPGFYFLHINRYNINAELTATDRVGFHKYSFNDEGNSKIIIDLKYGTGWDLLTKGSITQVGKNTVQGFRFSKGWAADQRIYFYTEFSKDIAKFDTLATNEEKGIITAIITFEGNGELMAKTAISPVSENGAKNNLIAEIDTEIGLWNFKAIKEMARTKWNTELGKIKIETENLSDKKTFYTALYHTMIAPSLFNDVNGDYRGADREIHENPGH